MFQNSFAILYEKESGRDTFSDMAVFSIYAILHTMMMRNGIIAEYILIVFLNSHRFGYECDDDIVTARVKTIFS